MKRHSYNALANNKTKMTIHQCQTDDPRTRHPTKKVSAISEIEQATSLYAIKTSMGDNPRITLKDTTRIYPQIMQKKQLIYN